MSSSTQPNGSGAIEYRQILWLAVKRAVSVASIISAAVWTLVCLEVHQILPIGRLYRSLPYGVQHPVDFLLLPGGVVWWCVLSYIGSELLAVILGFLVGTATYALLLFVPMVGWEFLFMSGKHAKNQAS
jgi:hypothetical protein